MIDLPILLADVGDIIKLLVLFVFIVGPLIGKLAGGRKPDRKPPQRPKQPQRPQPPQRPQIPPRPVAAQVGGRPQPNARAQLEAEVGRFLQNPGLQPKPVTVEEPITAEIIVEDPRSGSSVAEHVRGHIDSSSLREHATHLGDGLRQADESMEQHLHQVFDHNLGQLPHEQQQIARIAEGTDAEFWSDKPGTEGERSQPSHTAAEISKVIRNPENFKQAIILGEILTRREF